MMLWQSDKFVVVKKQSNVCRAKGLTCKRQNSMSLQSPMRQQMELRKADSDNSLGKNVCMKSRMWRPEKVPVGKIRTYGSLRAMVLLTWNY